MMRQYIGFFAAACKMPLFLYAYGKALCMEEFHQKTIAILYLGGRIQSLKNQAAFERWMQQFAELSLVGNIDPVLLQGAVFDDPKTPQGQEVMYCQRAARRMHRDWNAYDGFVVVLPFERSVFMANMIARMLPNAGKSIVCTTTLHSEEHIDDSEYTDIHLRANMVNALQVASTAAVAQSVFVTGTDIIEIPRAIFSETGNIVSQDSLPIGRIDFGAHFVEAKGKPDSRTLQRPQLHMPERQDVVYRYFSSRSHPIEELEAHPLPQQTHAVILRAESELSLKVISQIPSQVPVLLITPDHMYLSLDGEMHELSVDKRQGDAVAAALVFALEEGNDITALSKILMNDSI